MTFAKLDSTTEEWDASGMAPIPTVRKTLTPKGSIEPAKKLLTEVNETIDLMQQDINRDGMFEQITPSMNLLIVSVTAALIKAPVEDTNVMAPLFVAMSLFFNRKPILPGSHFDSETREKIQSLSGEEDGIIELNDNDRDIDVFNKFFDKKIELESVIEQDQAKRKTFLLGFFDKKSALSKDPLFEPQLAAEILKFT